MTAEADSEGQRTPHDRLFDEFVKDLSQVVDQAKTEWRSAVEQRTREGVSVEVAEAEVRKRLRYLGAHPRVIAVFRQYFLACDQLNKSQNISFQYPTIFTGERLMGKHQELWEILADLPYLPMGTDKQDRWV
jgi:hypothetical protein